MRKEKGTFKQNIMADLTTLKLKELRVLYPTIKAVSKEEFLRELAEQEAAKEIVVTAEVVVVPPKPAEPVVTEIAEANEPELDIVDFIYAHAKSRDKILIELPDSMEADNAFAILQEELFPKLQADGLMLVASSVRRDMSINGTCYVRLTCKKNFSWVVKTVKFNIIKTII